MIQRAILAGLMIFFLPEAAGAQGRLQQVRQQVQNAPQASPASQSEEEGDDDDDNILGMLLSGLFSSATSSEDSGDSTPATPARPRPRPRFLLYPYLGGYPGYMAPRQWQTQDEYNLWGDKLLIKPWLIRLSVEDGYDVHDINRVGTTLLADSVTRWGILTQWHVFHERLPSGTWDHLTLGDLNLTYRLVNEDWLNFRVGVGARALFDKSQSNWGPNFHLGSDVFFPKNVIASGTCDFGWVGDASVLHLHGQLGYIWRHWELFGGYDYQRIGTVSIQGPLLGLRLWF